jgi:hypothetical protein
MKARQTRRWIGPRPDMRSQHRQSDFCGAEEHRKVRIWGGIHFRNSLEVGEDMGKKIAAYLIDNSLKPTP